MISLFTNYVQLIRPRFTSIILAYADSIVFNASGSDVVVEMRDLLTNFFMSDFTIEFYYKREFPGEFLCFPCDFPFPAHAKLAIDLHFSCSHSVPKSISSSSHSSISFSFS